MAYDALHLQAVRQRLEQPVIPDRVVLEDGSEFLLTVVGRDEHEELAEELLAQEPDCQWGLKEWIAEAAFYPGFLVAIRGDGDDRSAGYLAFDTRASIWDHRLSGGLKSSVSITLEPITVYVAPSYRGQGFGDAFAQVMAHQVPALLERLAVCSRGDLADLGRAEVDFTLKAECVSAEGARFVRKVLAACEDELPKVSAVGAWRLSGGLHEVVDWDDWGPEEEERAVVEEVAEPLFHFRFR